MREIPGVVIGYVHPGTVRAEFMASVLATVMAPRSRVASVTEVRSGPNISRARNLLVSGFLREETAGWLWMLDTDMVFAPDALDRLLAAADERERPVVGALCFAEHPEVPGGEPFATMYERAEHGFAHYKLWPENSVMRVAATGAACLLVHRSVFGAVSDLMPGAAAPWFQETVEGDALIGEDMTFCLRAGAAGVPVHVHTGVQAGHMKTAMIGKVT